MMALDTVLFFVSIVLFRVFVFFVSSIANNTNRFILLTIFLMTIGFCSLPILLLKANVLDNNVPNILMAGFSMFYFPFCVAKISGNKKK